MIKTKVDHIYILETTPEYSIVVYTEAKKTSVDQINEYFDYLMEITEGMKFHYIIDISDTSPPSTKVRHEIKKRYLGVSNRILSSSVITGPNFMLKIAMKFVGASMGLTDYKTYNSIEKAKESILNEN